MTEPALHRGRGDRAFDAGAAFMAWIRETIEPWNVAGLAEPSRLNLYPVDFDDLLAAAGKLGLSPRAIRAALPRLRGATTR